MLVYRIEDDKGYGPYTSPNALDPSHVCHHMALQHQNTLTHPTPHEDGIRTITPNDRSGFINLPSLKAWFSDFLPLLLDAGYNIVSYEVPLGYVDIGISQLIYNASFATKRTILPPEATSYLHDLHA